MDEPTQPQLTESSPSGAAPKKPYSPPQVVVHGTVAELTLKLGSNPDQGGGSFPPQSN